MREIVSSRGEFGNVLERLERIENKLSAIEPQEKWLDNDDFVKKLKISKRTAQNYRDKGLIDFVQIGSKIYYNVDDIEKMLLKHKIKST